MPINDSSPHGNHFAGSLPNKQVNNNPYQPPRYTQSTESFMVASGHGPAGNAKPAAERGVRAPQAANPVRPAAARGSQIPTADVQTPRAAQYSQRPATRTAEPSAYTPSGKQPHKNGAGKIIGIVVSVILLAVVAFGATLGVLLLKDAKHVMGQSQAMMSDVSTLKEALMEGDGGRLNNTAQSIASQVSDIRSTIDGPAWTLASHIPVAGDDIRFARGLISQADNLVTNALVPACSDMADLKLSNLLESGKINVELLTRVIDTLQTIQPVVTASAQDIKALPEPHLGKLKDLSQKIAAPVETAAVMLPKINEVAPVIPGMLGADGPRTYLLMAQNSAELRGTGGLPGSVGTLLLNDGAITMGDFEPAGEITGGASSPYGRGLTKEEDRLFSDRVAGRMTDTNINPDFPRVAHFARILWNEQFHTNVDGVIMIDPIFLQYLLNLTGGMTSNGMQVDGTNAAKLLIHDSYNMLQPEETDVFFSGVAAGAFDNILGNLGNVNMAEFLQTIQKSADEGRFKVWMQNPDEEAAIEKLGFSGKIGTDPTTPELGVYFSDETWSKISWYFSDNTTMDAGTKNADGTTTYHVTTTMVNHLTPEEANGQVKYITGYNQKKRNVTDMVMHFYLFPPAGGTISNVRSEGADFSLQPITTMPYNDMQVTTGTYRLNGNTTATISYDVTVSAEAAAPLAVRTTPTAQVVAGWDQPTQ